MPGDASASALDAVGYEQLPDRDEAHGRRQRHATGFGVLAALTLAVIVVGPHVLTVARAVVNLPVSAVSVVWGRAHGGTCVIHDDLFITCESMDQASPMQGRRWGTSGSTTTLDGPDRYRHEARHADQWAMVGPSFPVLYGAEYVRTGGRQQNVFERVGRPARRRLPALRHHRPDPQPA